MLYVAGASLSGSQLHPVRVAWILLEQVMHEVKKDKRSDYWTHVRPAVATFFVSTCILHFTLRNPLNFHHMQKAVHLNGTNCL